ncbi:tctex1 domain-containing protein 4-like [Colossoma macropomum]|uniref:tctex1 domain-containing protein 4-like n=1 Tax=Colossoma macropomum TaxID=42526 RepID=UPI0018653974|nr:tctex1 domain-containing protein 4-like [Colossoma macropomum]
MEQKGSMKTFEKEQDGGNQQIKEVSWAASVTGRRLSRPIQRPSQTLDRTYISLKGLVTAQMFSKGLKERAAAKLAAKRGVLSSMRKPVTIIHEQVPVGCSQPGERFPNSRAFQLLQHFLNTRLDRVTYDPSSASQLVQEFSEEIRTLVHTVCPARYKLVCMVALGQKTGHEGVTLASRCLWDVHSDTCVSYTYQSPKLYCTVSLFAVYSE